MELMHEKDFYEINSIIKSRYASAWFPNLKKNVTIKGNINDDVHRDHAHVREKVLLL